jgi:hypothetical protein
MQQTDQLRYYIAAGAPPLRTPVLGPVPFLRPEVGFTPSWFHARLGVDFGQKWHESPEYRLEASGRMHAELRRCFPGRNIAESEADGPPDILTGLFGIAVMGLFFGHSMSYAPDKWPVSVGAPLSDEAAWRLTVPDIENHPAFHDIVRQVEASQRLTGSARGFLNWQGVLNTAFKLRGEALFVDFHTDPALARHVLEVVAETMIRGLTALYRVQQRLGTTYDFATVANCTVNMISGAHYRDFVLPCDQRIRSAFGAFGVHNCAWNATPYLEHEGAIPGLGYIDMGLETDLALARRLLPAARRNLLYRSIDLRHKSDAELRADFVRIARELAPCDVGLPDIEADVPDERILHTLDLCAELSEGDGLAINA